MISGAFPWDSSDGAMTSLFIKHLGHTQSRWRGGLLFTLCVYVPFSSFIESTAKKKKILQIQPVIGNHNLDHAWLIIQNGSSMLHQKTAVSLFMVAVEEMKTTLNQRRTVKPNAWLKILPAQRLLEFRSLEIFSYLMENPCMMDTHQTAMRMATLSQSSVNIT